MFQLQAQLSERRIQNLAQTKRGRMTGGRLCVPNDVEDDVLERRVFIVTVSAPTGVADVHLDVARDGCGIAELDHCVAEIWSAFHAAETWMQDAHALAVERGQHIAPETLMLPDGLKKLFWRRV